MEEQANKIINKFTNALSQINPVEYMAQIKNIKEMSKIIDISKKFCNIITNIKAQILFDISDEIQSLVSGKDKPISDKNNDNFDNINSSINNKLLKDLKSLLSQFKFKISNILSNINELNSSLTIISANLKKQKYSLASLRLEKLFKLKDNMNLNINSLEKLEIKMSNSLKSNNILSENVSISESGYNNLKNKIKPVKLAKTPPPLKNDKINFALICSNKKNINIKKNLSSNKIINYNTIKKNNTFKIIENRRDKNLTNISSISNKSINKSSIHIEKVLNKKRDNINEKEINNHQENIDKKIIITQKEIIERLKNEIDFLKQNNNNKINVNKNGNYKENENNIKLKLENNVLLFLNEKLKLISDLIFSITFSINNLQSNKISLDDEYNNIKNNLINMTSQISEIKSNLLKMSLENENIFKNEEFYNDNDNLFNINKINIENEFNLSLYKNKIKTLQKDNESLKSSIEQLKSKIITLTQLISSQEKNNIENQEIILLKEKIKIKEKRLTEMKGMYEADINSKNIIEKLLRKNIEEMKESYEQKISKLNKKLEEKGKEINEKNNLINKMNIKKIKSLNNNEEYKRLSSSTNNDDILKINDEISKVRYDKEIKNDFSLENSINLSLLKENYDENDKKDIKVKKLEDEINALKIINNKITTELNELKNDIKTKDEILSLKEINSSFANEINSIKNIMVNNNQKLEIEKKNSGNNQNELLKSKTYSNESDYDLINKLKNDLNTLQINKRNLEAQNKELNDKIIKKDKEIICLITNNNKEKKNLNEQHKNEIEKLNSEIKDKTNKNEEFRKEIALIQKKLIQVENQCANGGDISASVKSKGEQCNSSKKFEILEKKLNIILFIEGNTKLFQDNEEDIEDEDDEEEDDENDDEFIEKIKKVNKYRIKDNYEMKVYKKENKKLIHRYEFTLDENNELKKKMITIEEIVINKQNELYNNLKKGFIALLNYLTINNKSKDKVIYFLNLIQYSTEEIKIIINSKK